MVKQIKIKIQQAYAKAQQAEIKAQQAEIKAQQAEIKAQQAEIKAQQAEIKAQQAEFIINSMKNNSLLQAKAFREVIKNLFYLQYRLKTKFKNYIKFWLVKFKIIINRSPRLRWTTLYIMDRFPALKRYLHIKQATLVTNNLKDMSPHVRQIYAELKSVIENKMKQ
jgi:multidrug efflux pump subunit AcrA (membrane-fusion protein)